MRRPAPRWLSWLETPAYWAVIGLLALGAVGYDVALEQHNKAYSACIAKYNDDYSAVAVLRSKATEQQTAATTEVLTSVIDASQLPPAAQKIAVTKAVAKYRTTIAEVQAERARSPLPDPPSDRC